MSHPTTNAIPGPKARPANRWSRTTPLGGRLTRERASNPEWASFAWPVCYDIQSVATIRRAAEHEVRKDDAVQLVIGRDNYSTSSSTS
jgi:hypothetical protein